MVKSIFELEDQIPETEETDPIVPFRVINVADSISTTKVVPIASPNSITDIKIDSSGNLIISMSNGVDINAGVVKGIKGDKGDKGDLIPSPSIVGVNIDNTTYKMTILMSDGTTFTPDVELRGPIGPEGDRGPRGWRGYSNDSITSKVIIEVTEEVVFKNTDYDISSKLTFNSTDFNDKYTIYLNNIEVIGVVSNLANTISFPIDILIGDVIKIEYSV